MSKKRLIEAFLKELEDRWKNIKRLYENFPSEGLVLSYCFTEALGYYRFGFGEKANSLTSIEQFITILYQYQSNGDFLIVPHDFVKTIPLEKKKRQIGKKIRKDFLQWLQNSLPKNKCLSMATIWEQTPKNIIQNMGTKGQEKIGYLYQITLAGFYYYSIRNAGIHHGNYPIRNIEDNWQRMKRANNEIIMVLKEECFQENKYPYELEQPKAIMDVVY